MTHPVNLKPGMTAIRRDGERKEPVVRNRHPSFPFAIAGEMYKADGSWGGMADHKFNIIAAGFPWTELGAQVGDTVRRVWNGTTKSVDNWCFSVPNVRRKAHPDSLYVITARAAKPADSEIEWGEWKIGGAPINSDAMQIERIGTSVRHRLPKQKFADRPRASHKLNLCDGDVVELVAWQDGRTDFIGARGVQTNGLVHLPDVNRISRNSFYPKGNRPLFLVISRAADATPDEVINFFAHIPEVPLCKLRAENDTHRFTLTFPPGSNTGTVEREAL